MKRGRPFLYLLDDNNDPYPVDDWSATGSWGLSYENIALDRRRVGLTPLGLGIEVSTVFLGVDHGYGDSPRLYETMVFYRTQDGRHDIALDPQWRWEDKPTATIGHRVVVAFLWKRTTKLWCGAIWKLFLESFPRIDYLWAMWSAKRRELARRRRKVQGEEEK